MKGAKNNVGNDPAVTNTDKSSHPERRSESQYTKKLKKTIIISFVVMLTIVGIYYAAVYLIENSGIDFRGDSKDGYNPTKQSIDFVTPDYDENIYDDSYYMGLDRNIYIHDIDSGVTLSINGDSLTNYGEDVRFMYNFVNFIIAGDAEEYNACFSENYYLTDGNEEKEAFTMQKLYNIKITCISTTETNGVTVYLYTLEYMIRHNNGTLRLDMGSDASKVQYITISDVFGWLLIDDISYVTMK